VSRTAFGILHRELGKRLVAGRLVVVDATNLTEAARVALLRRAGAAKVPASAIVLVPAAALVHARNAARPGRVVPADVVDRQLAAATALGANAEEIVARLRTEGFAAVHVLQTAAAIDELSIVRSPRPIRPR
jgi:protein phosphatase